MDDEFEVFWKHYPRKAAKGDARKAWMQMTKFRPPLAVLLAAIKRAKESEQWRRDSGQFIPYPATWLRGERWDDVYEIEIEPQGNWWDTASGIYAKADELGVKYAEGEPAPFVRDRVKAEIGRRERALRVVA